MKRVLITAPLLYKVDKFLDGVTFKIFTRKREGPVLKEDLKRLHEMMKSFKPNGIFINYPSYMNFKKEFWENVYPKFKKELKCIVTLSVGFDYIDIAEAQKNGNISSSIFMILGVYVCNCKGINAKSTSEMSDFFFLWIDQIDNNPKNWYKRYNYFETGNLVYGKTLGLKIIVNFVGIVGFGSIGRELYKRAKFGFGMKIIYFKRNRLSIEEEQQLGVEYRKFEDLLKESDVVSVNCPLNKDSQYLFTMKEFKMMKKTAYFVNTARGKIVKEIDLIEAMEKKVIKGAGMDVYENEYFLPISGKDSVWYTLRKSGVICLPHISWYVDEEFALNEECCLLNLKVCLIENKKPPNCVF